MQFCCAFLDEKYIAHSRWHLKEKLASSNASSTARRRPNFKIRIPPWNNSELLLKLAGNGNKLKQCQWSLKSWFDMPKDKYVWMASFSEIKTIFSLTNLNVGQTNKNWKTNLKIMICHTIHILKSFNVSLKRCFKATNKEEETWIRP